MVALADHDGDAKAHQRADVGDPAAIGADDLHRLPHPGERRHDLADPRIAAARIGVDLGQEFCLGSEIDQAERVLIGIEAAVGARRRPRHHPGIASRHRPHRRRGAPDRRLGQVGGVGIAGRLASHRAQPEPLGRVEAGALDAAVVERQALRLAVFEIELAIVHPGQRLAHDRLDPARVHAGALEKQLVGDGEIGHPLLLLNLMPGYNMVAVGRERKSRSRFAGRGRTDRRALRRPCGGLTQRARPVVSRVGDGVGSLSFAASAGA